MPKFIVLILFCVLFQCQSTPTKPSKIEDAKLKGHPIFIEVFQLVPKSTKHLNLKIQVANLTDQSIRNFRMLFFARDKQDSILIPESYKTPELICQISKIPADRLSQCLLQNHLYAVENPSLFLNSVSLTMEDGTRHFISGNELEEIYEWK